jgi:hypothetical protein
MKTDQRTERGEAFNAAPEHDQRAALTIAQIDTGSVARLEPEFLTITAACRFAALGRTVLYQEIRAGRIKSISLRKNGAERGRRLVSVASLRQYLHSFADSQSS